MKKVSIASRTFVFALLVAMIGLYLTPSAEAQSSYYTTNCQSCHGTVSTCNGCHAHGTHSSSAKNNVSITGTTNKTTYAPGETVTVTINGGYRTGWVRTNLYDQSMNQLARSTGTIAAGYIAPAGGPAFPVTLTAPAPATAGTYTWSVSWYGNQYDASGAYFQPACSAAVLTNCWKASTNPNHGEAIVAINAFTVSGGTPTCTRNAPTVTFNTAAQSVAAGGTVSYTATVTNKDSGTSCTNSTFALSVASETGTAANFVLPSSVSATTPNPCSLAPGGSCTATVTVRAQTAATAGAADVTTVRAADSANHSALPGSGAVTSTVAASTSCTRNAPTVTFNTTSQTIVAGGAVAYTATVTNRDSGTSCTNSTFALSAASETGTAANFVLPSTISATTPNPCSLAPGGTCTATVSVRAQTAATAGAANVTTIRAADSTNHTSLPGSGAVTSTIAGAAANYTLTVASSNPNSGVAIAVSPNDRNGRGNGTTQFTRSYSSSTNITLTAPQTTGSYTFQKWQRNGVDYATTRAITFQLDMNRTMTAVYVSSSTTYTMTIASSNPNSGVSVAVSPNDINGRGNGSTQFTRSYRIGAAVSLTAPATAGGNAFQKWQRGTTDVSTNRTITVTVNSSFTMRAVYGTSTSSSNYTILASNDLGMHCACPGTSNFLLLPPFNTIRAQAFQKGSDNPSVIGDTSKFRMTYSILENTDAGLKADPYYADWIAFSPKLFPGYQPIRADGRVQSISGATLSGDMTVKAGPGAWWEVVGTPAYPVVTGTSTDIMIDPLGGPNRTPYLTGRIQLLDKATSAVLATDDITVPVAFGGCCSCHLSVAQSYGYSNPTPRDSFNVMGMLHSGGDAKGMINFAKLDPTGDGTGGPIRCSWCHWDPAMGESAAPGLSTVWPNYQILAGANFTKADVRTSVYSFSEVLHRFHTQSPAVLAYDPNIAKNCYDCHPGNNVNCYRDTHTTKTINGNAIWCTDCHGDLNQRVAQGQLSQPWQASTLPKCATCHGNNYGEGGGALNTGIFGQFLNSSGHEGQKVLCSSCHGSPHALNPSTLAKDNAQNIRLQNDPRPIGVCNVCHTNRSNTWAVPPHSGGD